MGWSLYLPYRIGHLNFSSISIMAFSAYFTGVALREWGWPFFLTVIISMMSGLILSYIVSKLVINVSGFTVVIIGLTSIFIIRTVIENCHWLGGSIGFFNIPIVSNLAIWTYVILFILGYILFLVEDSVISKKAFVLFSDKELGDCLGIHRHEIAQFLHSFSGILAGLAGTLYAALIGGINVDFFNFSMIGTLMAILFVGGYTSMWGVVFAAPILGGIPIFLPDKLLVWKQIIFGGLLITILCIKPEGIITRKQAVKIKNWFKFINKKIFDKI